MQSVIFEINTVKVIFRVQDAIADLLYADDNYAKEYIKKLACEGKLPMVCKLNANNFEDSRIERVERDENKENMPTEPEPEITEPSSSQSTPETQIIWKENRRSSASDVAATYAMLELRGNNKYRRAFNDKRHPRNALWNEIGIKLEAMGYNMGTSAGRRCSQKYANLLKPYKEYERNVKQTGAARIDKPPLYDELHAINHGKDKINPPYLFDSMESEEAETQADGNVNTTSGASSEDECSTPQNTQTGNRFLHVKTKVKRRNISVSDVLIEFKEMEQERQKTFDKLLEFNIKQHQEDQIFKEKLIKSLDKICKCSGKKQKKRKYQSSDSDSE